MRIYALITDAYGGHGGISVYNRDMLEAFTRHPSVQEVIAVPRVISHPLENMPARLLYRVAAAGEIGAFLRCILRDLPKIAKSDLIYCGHLNLAPLAWVLGQVFRKPVLGALYGIEAWQPDQKILRRMAAKHLDHYYAISAFTRDRFCAWSGVVKDHVTLLPNAIHLQDYGLAKKSPDLGARYGLEGKKVLMTFGRLVSRERAKGFDEVLDVLPELLQETPEIAYVIAGDGPDRDRLAARVRDLGLENYVVFTGFVDEAEKAALYSLAHPGVLQKVADAFSDPDIDGVYGDLDYVAPDNPDRIIRHWKSGPFHPRNLARGWMPPHPTLYLRRDVFERLGVYDTSYQIAADYDAMLRWLGAGRLRAAYIPEVLVKMRLGGESNRSLGRILQKSREDYRAIRNNGIGGIATLVMKNTRKIRQFF